MTIDSSGVRQSIGPGAVPSLLGLLAIRLGQPVPRDQLIDEMWNSDPPATATNALRNRVTRLRQTLEPLQDQGFRLDTGAGSYRLEAPDDAIDIRRFEAGWRRIEQASTGTSAINTQELELLLDLWQGEPFLGSANDTLQREAERLELIRLDILERLAEGHLQQGSPQMAVDLVDDVATAHPERERLTAAAMVALYQLGRPTEALSRYDQLNDWLAEIGAVPGRALQDLRDGVLCQSPHLDPPADSGQATPASLPPSLAALTLDPIVGRDALLSSIDDTAARAVARGRSSLQLLVGEPGIGKSRLLAEIAQHGSERGMRLIHAWAAQPGIGDTDLLQQVVRTAAIEPHPADQAASGSALLAMVERLELVIRSSLSPVMIVLDDMQWADPMDVEALLLLLKRAEVTVAIVAATRPAGLERPQLTRLTQLNCAEMRRIMPLQLPDIEALVTATSGGHESDRPRAAALATASGGNPFYLTALIRANPSDELDHEVPPAVEVFVEQRLASIEPLGRQLLQVAAIIGRSAPIGLIARCLGCDPAEIVVHALHPSMSEFIDTDDGSASRIRFRHDIVRTAILATTPKPSAIQLHQTVVRNALDTDCSPLQLAHHTVAAGSLLDDTEALSHLRRGVESAERDSRYREVLEFASAAFERIGQRAVTATGWRLRLATANALQALGQVDRSFAMLADLVDDAIDSGDWSVVADSADLVARFANSFTGGDRILELLSVAHAALVDVDPLLAAEIGCERINQEFLTLGPIPHCVESLQQLNQLAVDDRDLIARRQRANMYLGSGSSNAAARLAAADTVLGHSLRPLSVGTAAPDVYWLDGCFYRIGALLLAGRTDDARGQSARFRLGAERSRRPEALWLASVIDAHMLQLDGELDKALITAERARDFAVDFGVPDGEASFAGFSTVDRLLRGSRDNHRNTLRQLQPFDGPVAPWSGCLALCEALAGDKDEATRIVDYVIDRLARWPPNCVPDNWLFSVGMAAETAIRLGNPDIVDRAWELAQPLTGIMVPMAQVGTTLGPGDRLLAELARQRGDTNAAIDHAQAAVALAIRANSPTWLDRCHATMVAITPQ